MLIVLSQKEYDVLMKEEFLSEKYKIYIQSNIDSDLNLNINEDQADEIREECLDYLSCAGFDKNDEPTEKGLILEDLIDKFFTG